MTANHSVASSNLSKRTIFAPQPIGFLPAQLPTTQVLNVELDEDEDIEWTWTTLPTGQQYVSGYTIIPKSSDGN